MKTDYIFFALLVPSWVAIDFCVFYFYSMVYNEEYFHLHFIYFPYFIHNESEHTDRIMFTEIKLSITELFK